MVGSKILLACWIESDRNDLASFCCFVQEAEKRGKNLEMEMCKLQKRLEERNCQLEASAFAADKVYFSIYQLSLSLFILDYISSCY